MIFKKISYRLAIQFTGFVFLLLLVAGSMFITSDYIRRDRMAQARLERQLRPILQGPALFGRLPPMPPFIRERIRIVDEKGNSVFSGTFYENIPFEANEGRKTFSVDGESYEVLTIPYMQAGEQIGYVQMMDISTPYDPFGRIILFLVVSIGISGLTFGIGLWFARNTLRPAQQMMERLEQFTQDASHELRTPLTAVSTSLDMALTTKEDQLYVRKAKEELKDVVTLVERLLELARLDKFALQTESVSFNSLIEECIKKYEPIAQEKDVTIDTDLQPMSVDGDPALLRRLICNLLSNAIKFNKENGTITLRLTPEAFVIQDTGKGIAEKALPKIFNRFYQEDSSRTKPTAGVGLGLALVKRIVELHSWTIEVISKKSKGTTFTVHFV